MIYGPLSKLDIEILKGLLDREGATYSITHSIEDLQTIDNRRSQEMMTAYPSFGGIDRFLYIEIQSSDLLIVRGELEKMGFVVRSKAPQPESEMDEFLCPRCKYYSHEPGECPQHKLALLEFSSWVTETNRRRRRWLRLIAALVVAIMIAIFILENLGNKFPAHSGQ